MKKATATIALLAGGLALAAPAWAQEYRQVGPPQSYGRFQPSYTPDFGMSQTTPQTGYGYRAFNPYAQTAVRGAMVAGGRAAFDAMGYGRARAVMRLVRPSPYGAAAMMLMAPNTAYAPAPGDPITRRPPRY